MAGEPPSRAVLDQEWWLAALQEPLARFKPFEGQDWPTTTLPAFEVAACAPAAGGGLLGLQRPGDKRRRTGMRAVRSGQGDACAALPRAPLASSRSAVRG